MADMAPLTPPQIRAARALLDWSQDQLAEKAAVSLSTVRDYEKERRGGEIEGLKAIRRALENDGVVFISGDNHLGPGVRLATGRPTVLRRPVKLGRWGELMIPIEWRGNEYAVLIPREILDDFGRFRGTPEDAEYLRVFDEHRAAILDAAATALGTSGRVSADRRVSLTHDDFPEFR